MNKQKILLGVLLVGLCLALFYAFWASPVPEQGRMGDDGSRVQRGNGKGRALRGDLEKYRVQLDLLERGVKAFREPKRDLFQLGPAKPPTPPPRPATAMRPAPPPVQVVPRPVPPAVMTPPPVRLSALGYLQTERGSKVFLSSGSSLYIVDKGTRFGPKQEFFVEEFTPEEVVVRQADRSEPIRLSLKSTAAESAPSGFSSPSASPFRIRPRAVPPPPDVPDEFMNDVDDEVPSEDEELDTDEAGDEGSPGKEGVNE